MEDDNEIEFTAFLAATMDVNTVQLDRQLYSYIVIQAYIDSQLYSYIGIYIDSQLYK